MLIAASGDGQSSSEDEDSAELHPSGVVAAAELDPELTAVLSRAAARSGLEACTPPSLEPSQRDDWLLGTGRGSRPRPALVPFFPEVHEELMKLWTAPFYGQKRLVCLLTLARDPSCQRPRECGWGTAGPPHAPLASPNRDSGSSARMSQNAGPSVPSSLTPIRCTTAGTSIVPLEPLARRLEAWLALPSPSRWLTHTIRLGYAIQFARRPPKFSGVLETALAARNAPVLREEIAVLLARMQSSRSLQPRWGRGFTALISSYPRKAVVFDQSWIATPEPGPAQAPVQDVDAQAHDQMHTAPGLVCSDRPEGCLLSCFDPSATQTVPTVCVRGSGMAVQGPPLWALPVPPCLHEGRGGCPCPVMEVGIRILNCLEHGPRARTVVRSQGPGASAPQPVGASGQLGKEQALPCAENLFSWCGVDSVSMTARLTEERAQSVLNCLSSFRGRTVVSLKLFQRLLGHMASAAAVTPLGLLHMRPLQHWLHSRVPKGGMAPRCTSGEYHTGVSPLL